MHYHVPKPFYRKSRDTWYVEVDGRQINLGRDRETAFQRYHAIMASPPEVRPTHAMGTGEGLKLTELFDRFLDWVKQHRSPDTYVWYQYRLQRFADRFPDLTIGQLRPYHVQEWVDSFPDHSPTTTRNYMRSVKRCIKWGQTLGYIDTNPIQHISIPASTPKDVYLTPEEFARLLSETRDANFRDLLEVTYETGCRPQESLRIEIRHIDLPNQRWVLPRSEAKGKQAPRVVYLSDKAIEITRRLTGDRTAGVSVRGTHLVRRRSVAGIVRGADGSGGDFLPAFLTIVAFAVGHLACLFDAMHQHQFRMSRGPVVRQQRGQGFTWRSRTYANGSR